MPHVITLKAKVPVKDPIDTVITEDTPSGVDLQGRVKGLLKVASDYKYHARDLMKSMSTLHKMFVIPAILRGDMETVWEYLNTDRIWTNTSSRNFGVKTRVDNYTNKKGETFLAHYTEHKNYLRRCKQGEEDGIYYNGQFPIGRTTHKVVSNCNATMSLEECFEGILPLEP